LLLLLRTDVDSPPDWVGDVDVLVGNISDFSRAFISWVSLNINCFQRSGEFDVSKDNISDTVVILVRRNRPNTHSNTQVNINVLNENILCAVDTITSMTCFWNNGIIEVGDVDISERSVSSSHIDSISVQWEPRHREFKSIGEDGWEFEDSEWLKHTHVVCNNFEVVHIDVFAVLWHNIERGRVVDFDSTHFDSFSGHKINKLWSMSNIQVKEFSDPPHEALTIDLTTS